MTTTVHDILEAFCAIPVSNRERGDKFERLMVQYLKLDPLCTDKFSDVWIWADWPGNGGKTSCERPGHKVTVCTTAA